MKRLGILSLEKYKIDTILSGCFNFNECSKANADLIYYLEPGYDGLSITELSALFNLLEKYSYDTFYLNNMLCVKFDLDEDGYPIEKEVVLQDFSNEKLYKALVKTHSRLYKDYLKNLIEDLYLTRKNYSIFVPMLIELLKIDTFVLVNSDCLLEATINAKLDIERDKNKKEPLNCPMKLKPDDWCTTIPVIRRCDLMSLFINKGTKLFEEFKNNLPKLNEKARNVVAICPNNIKFTKNNFKLKMDETQLLKVVTYQLLSSVACNTANDLELDSIKITNLFTSIMCKGLFDNEILELNNVLNDYSKDLIVISNRLNNSESYDAQLRKLFRRYGL